jgi:hypothetical protein
MAQNNERAQRTSKDTGDKKPQDIIVGGGDMI